MNEITLPLLIQTRMERIPSGVLYIPEVVGHANFRIQRNINTQIEKIVDHLIKRQHEEQAVPYFSEMIGTYEIKTNERDVLSLTLENYAYAPYHAHGLTLLEGLTVNSRTGKPYRLKDLFKPNCNYVAVLFEIVNEQIKERDIPTFEQPVQISKNQPFYIADKALVLFFPLYEITPYYYGFPMFPISVYEIADIVSEDGPLGKMMA